MSSNRAETRPDVVTRKPNSCITPASRSVFRSSGHVLRQACCTGTAEPLVELLMPQLRVTATYGDVGAWPGCCEARPSSAG
jgi:hypothetical protein